MNLFGFDIAQLDVASFMTSMRLVFVVLAFVAIVLCTRSQNDRLTGRAVFAVALAGFTLAWCATMFPLQNTYGTNGSQDRENHLGWANMVAQGFSPLRTFQVAHLHFEPLWPLLTAIASGFNPDRVPLVFQWAPLLVGLGLAFALQFAWTRGDKDATPSWIEGGFAVLGVLLLMAVPGDFTGPFRNPWALTFLLKPNHALGLVLTPLAGLALARAHSWKTRLFAGFVLQLVGWAFVIHMALFVAGLVVFVALSWMTRRSDRVKDLIDCAAAVGANLLIVSPYIVMLVIAYPFLHGMDAYRLSPFSERPFEGPLRLGILALVSGFGAWNSYRDGGRLGRILSSQWLAAHIIWQAFPILGLLGQAREQDEAFYWCRFWTGLFAGVGAFQAVRLFLSHLRTRAADQRSATGLSAATTLLLLLPSLLPAWWNPSTMDQYFVAASKPLPDWIDQPTRFIRDNTPKDAVFAGDRNYARWIAAYGARRVLLANSLNLPGDHERRMYDEYALLISGDASKLRDAHDLYGIRYVLATSDRMEQAPQITLDHLMAQPRFETVYDRQFSEVRVVILRLLQQGVP